MKYIYVPIGHYMGEKRGNGLQKEVKIFCSNGNFWTSQDYSKRPEKSRCLWILCINLKY